LVFLVEALVVKVFTNEVGSVFILAFGQLEMRTLVRLLLNVFKVGPEVVLLLENGVVLRAFVLFYYTKIDKLSRCFLNNGEAFLVEFLVVEFTLILLHLYGQLHFLLLLLLPVGIWSFYGSLRFILDRGLGLVF